LKNMKLICPSCGAVAGADAWENDAAAREMLKAACELPSGLQPVLLGYLSLFRPGKSALSWKKALRVTRDLAALVAAGHVQVQGKVSRPCPVRIWATAIEQMVERRGSLQLPLPNHNYLRQIAWSLADAADARNEQVARSNEVTGHRRDQQAGVEEISPIMKQYLEKHGDPLKKVSGGINHAK
jgi:hypothetical protein